MDTLHPLSSTHAQALSRHDEWYGKDSALPLDRPMHDAAPSLHGAEQGPTWWRRLIQSARVGLTADPWTNQQAWQFGRRSRLSRAQTDFQTVLADLDSPEAEVLRIRVRKAREFWHLWNLRSRMFDAISRAHSQEEAQHRLDRLERYFRRPSSRTSFGSL